jgi:hypothetical protein
MRWSSVLLEHKVFHALLKLGKQPLVKLGEKNSHWTVIKRKLRLIKTYLETQIFFTVGILKKLMKVKKRVSINKEYDH